jgi:predicted GNAT family acetyltransferase
LRFTTILSATASKRNWPTEAWRSRNRLTTGKIEFTHTKVPPEHEGQGIGSALIHAALCEARARKLKVVPSCAFFAAYMKKHEEVQDLLDSGSRASLGLE